MNIDPITQFRGLLSYVCRNLRLRCLTGFLIHLCVGVYNVT